MAERLADHEETSSTPTAGAMRLKAVQEVRPILTIIWPILNYSASKVPCASGIRSNVCQLEGRTFGGKQVYTRPTHF